MKTSDILKQLMLAHKENAYQLAERSGVPQPTIQRILTGRHAEPRSSTLRKLAACYELSESHLRGDLIYSVTADDAQGVKVHASSKRYEPFQKIEMDASVADSMAQSASSLSLRREWLEAKLGVCSPSLKLLTCEHADMQPTIGLDDWVIYDGAIKQFESDGVYVILIQKQRLIRRLRKRLDGHIEVSCDSPSVKTVELLSKVRGLLIEGRVLWSWHGRAVS